MSASTLRRPRPLTMPPKRRTAEADILSSSPNNNTVPSKTPATQPPAIQPPPLIKRQRVSRACDQCRAAREKCDGVQPECFPCISQRRSCTYEISPKKRGVQTGYIRTLELALGWVFDEIPGTEEALNRLIAHSGGQGQTIFTGKDPSGAERLQKRWRTSRVHQSIDYLLSGGTLPVPDENDQGQSIDTPDSDGNNTRKYSVSCLAESGADLIGLELSSPRSANSGYCQQLDRQSNGEQRNTPLPCLSRSRQSGLARLKLPSNHWRLLDIYFSYTHSWLPILEKQAIFQTSYLYPEEGQQISPSDPSSAVHAELWAALALASLQSSLVTHSSTSDSTSPSPVEIYQTARNLLPSENGPFRIHHARAIVLLCLFNMEQEKLTSAWMMVGSAIRILLSLGPAQSSGQGKEKERITLALMSCFILDTVLSVRLGQPSHLRADDVANYPPAPEDSLDQWEPWTPCDGFGPPSQASLRSSRNPAFCMSTFNHLCGILRVVSSVMLEKQLRLSLRGSSGDLLDKLKQAMSSSAQLGNFALAPKCGTSTVPTPYIVRAIYLWANALIGPSPQSSIALLDETLGQYRATFGQFTLPSIISSCLASIPIQEDESQGWRDQAGQRHSYVAAVWSEARQASGAESRAGSFALPTHHRLGIASSAQDSSSPQPDLAYPSHVMVPINNTQNITHQNLPAPIGNGCNSYDESRLPVTYQQPFTNPPTALPTQNSSHIDLHVGSISSIASMSSIPPLQQTHHFNPSISSTSGAKQPSHSSHPSLFPAHPNSQAQASHAMTVSTGHPAAPITAGVGAAAGGELGVSPDYEALLDDLASIECTDAVDVDPQFMTNLGFVAPPGMDIAEVLARDFGG